MFSLHLRTIKVRVSLNDLFVLLLDVIKNYSNIEAGGRTETKSIHFDLLSTSVSLRQNRKRVAPQRYFPSKSNLEFRL